MLYSQYFGKRCSYMDIVVLCGGSRRSGTSRSPAGPRLPPRSWSSGTGRALRHGSSASRTTPARSMATLKTPRARRDAHRRDLPPTSRPVRASRKLKSESMVRGPRARALRHGGHSFSWPCTAAAARTARSRPAFDLLGIKYTASGHLGSAIAMDKDLTKRVVAPLGVLTPEWKLYDARTLDPEAVCAEARAPLLSSSPWTPARA